MKNPIYATDQKLLIIGRKGENLAQPIIFNVSDWHSQFGTGGSLALLHKRATDEDAYPCTTTIEGSVLTWKPTSGDTGVVGYGEAELRYSINGVVVKSKIWQTQTLKALDGNATVPSPWQSYVDAVASNATRAENVADAIENMTVGAETSDTTTVTKTIVDDVVHLQFGLQKGQKGDTGAKGDKGDPTDVRINNQSVVTDGVANIKLYSNSLQYNQSGISIPQTPQNRIDNRSQNSAVTTDRINHAVKAALTDGRHMTLTEDEQATAKEVLGVTDPAPLTKEAIDEALETDIVEDVGDLETALSTHEANTTDAHGIDVVKSHLNQHTQNNGIHVTASEKTTWSGKQDALTAGDNITIENNVISATGGSVEREWVLKGTITDGSAVSVDLTGCTELYIVGSGTSVSTTGLKLGDVTVASSIWSGAVTNAIIVYYADALDIALPIYSKKGNTIDSVNTALTIKGYTGKVCTIRTIGFTTTTGSYDIKIYAR